ncbi:MAG: DCC1-like thiol-disulfide oxidoreductase family protein [Actinomycetota bacterium]
MSGTDLPLGRDDSLPDSAVLLFDGDCGMCTRSARLLLKLVGASTLDSDGERVDIVPSRRPGVLQRTGVTAEQASASVWTVADDSTVVGGPAAIALAIAIGRQQRWPLWPFAVPGVQWLLDRIYAAIAANRGRFPGETPWCEQHPEHCV